jgi:hypothetical protein
MPRVILGTLVVSAFLGAAICRQADGQGRLDSLIRD